MKKLLILIDRVFKKHEDLALAIEKEDKDVKVFLKKIDDIDILIDKDEIVMTVDGVDLKDFDLVFFRRVGNMHVVGSVIIYLDQMGVPFIDEGLRETGIRGDKLTSLVRCFFAGAATIPTYYCNHKDFDKKIKALGKKFGYPLIAKKIHEHFLKGIYIIKNEEDIKLLKDHVSTARNKRFIFQPFIDMECEYRLLVLGDEVRSINSRVMRSFEKMKVDYMDPDTDEIYLGVNDFPKEIKDMAIKVAKTLNIQIAGVDICRERGTGKNYVLEVNRGPDLNYDIEMSPELPELVKYLTHKVKQVGSKS
jgi:glutathione synthase/RimK-type ligase-like ATP-grasp enzyme